MGLLDQFQGPLANWARANRYGLMGFAGNVDNEARNFAQALQPAFKGFAQGSQLDSQAAVMAAQEAERQQGIQQQAEERNQLLETLQREAPDLVPLIGMGRADEAFNTWMGRKFPQAGATADPTDDMQEYQFYANQEIAAGRNPVPFQEWMHPTEAPEPGFTQLTPAEVAATPGLDPAKAWQRGPDNRIYEIGGGGVTVNNDLNAGQASAAGYADRMANAETILSDPAMVAAMTDVGQQIGSSVPGVGNFLTSPQRQQAEQAQRDFINAILRRESGAVISPSEFENARLQYFPQPGDSPEVIAQKKRNREIALAATARTAGSNYTPPDLTPPGVTDPLGIR